LVPDDQATGRRGGRPPVGRSVVATRHGIVATSHPLAAMAGVQMLERGGTAIDAAIAANAVLGVVEPMMSGIGGDLFAIVSDGRTGSLSGLNASGWSPARLTPSYLAKQRPHSDPSHAMPERGILSVTVPGAVAGWASLRERFGRLPLAKILEPAIRYAEDGFPVSEIVARMWALYAPALAADPGARATYLPDNRAPASGALFRNPDLARSLERIGAEGPTAFYRGHIADTLVRYSEALGGPLEAADLAEFEPEWVTPMQAHYRGWTVSELPPNSQGIAALLMLGVMEQFPIREYGFHSARALHIMIEAKKLAFADLLREVGDPRSDARPVGALLQPDHHASRAALIDMRRASASALPSTLTERTRGSDTIYVAAVDRSGTIVSLIQSIYMGFGAGLVAPGTGFALQNRGALFSLAPGHPNILAPRRRPLHTIIPGFMERDGVRIGFGIMGGWNQAQAHAQFVSAVADFGLSIQEALEAGRFTKPTVDGRDVKLEAHVPASTRQELQSLGHEVETVPTRTTNDFGFGQAVLCRPDGVHFGASDPRHDGAAIPEGTLVSWTLERPG
jgi:gamma-glutamyltranspeptidase / glutathione hydrolase